ncbi:MAG: tetratricopeptide repeat protein, partial [Ignavibacteriota bacterium]
MKLFIKTSLTLVIVIFSIGLVNAQNRKLDSLNILISKAVTDTSQINLSLIKLDIFSTINLDSAINLGLKVLEKSQSIKFYRGEVDVRIKLIYNYCYKGNFSAASEQLKFLGQVIKPTNDSSDYADFYSVNGLFNGMQSKYDSSIYYYKKSIRIYERIRNSKRLAQTYSNIAIGYQQQSNFPAALLYFQKAIDLYNRDKNKLEIAYAYLNLAGTYSNLGDFERSEITFLTTIELAKKNLLKNVELYAYTNLSSLYMDQQNWQKSYEFAIKAAELGNVMGDHGIQAASLSKASLSLSNLKEFDKAFDLSKQAIFLADSSEQPFIINQAYSSLGFALMMQKNFKAAIPYYEKGLNSLKDADLYIAEIGKIFKELSECYEKTGSHSKALEMFKQFSLIQDSVRSRDNIQKATELTMNYEFNKKQESEKAIQQAKDDVTYARQVGLIVGLVLSFIIILGAFIGYYNKRKANNLLQQQKEEIENTLVKLKNTQAQLIQSEKLASLGEMTAGIAHEIKNPLNFVNNFSEVSNELIDELKIELKKNNLDGVTQIVEELKQNLERINLHGKRADSIVKGMLLHSRGTS